MSELVWTTEKPTEQGEYWWRYDRHSAKCFVHVTAIKGDLYAWSNALGYEEVMKWNGEWAGPIPAPKELT